MNRKAVSVLTVALVIVVFVGYEFGYKATRAKNEEWAGEIVEKTRNRRWWKGFRDPLEGARYRYYNHYWQVRCEDGSTIEAEVLYSLWNRSNVGDPVRKTSGERWPFIDTPEARQHRQITDELIGGVVERLGSGGD